MSTPQVTPQFDVDAARRSGATDDQILSYLSQRSPNFDVQGALKQASKGDVINYLATHAQSPASAPPAPTATIGAQHEPDSLGGKIEQTWNNFANDIRYGGEQTAVGRLYKFLGGQPTTAGTSEGVSDFMASPILGTAKAAQGVGQVMQPGKRMQGAGNVAGGLLQAATIPASFASPVEGEVAAQIPGKVGELIPSTERAGQMFASVAKDANAIPVTLDNAGDAALRLMDWQKKANLGPTVNKFLNRITNPNLGPLTYEEGREWYQLLGNLSADENLRLAPAIKRDLTAMVAGLKQDIGNAAGQVGRQADYNAAMSQYRTAAQLRDLKDAVKQNAGPQIIKGGASALGAGAVGAGAWKLYNLLKGN